jgi:hypothetical protein
MVALGLGLGLEQGLELLEVGLELDPADQVGPLLDREQIG